MFQKAVKYEAKGRVALVGPAGSGKSFTMLTLATALAGGGKIAAVDTEHGSLSKYADRFTFDVIELASFSPERFLECLHAAEEAKYAVFCCDSLSHFWMGKDGALEFVDVARKRSSSRDDMAGWKEFRPHERAMVDAMIASPLHVVCTMRTKNEYVSVEKTFNGKTKTVREKIGLAPVQREGLEYEFDLVMTLNDENEAIVDKTRCPLYAGKVIARPGAKDFAPFVEWLKGAPPVEREPVDVVRGTEEDQQRVAAAKLEALKGEGSKDYKMLVAFGDLKKQIAEVTETLTGVKKDYAAYYEALNPYKSSKDITDPTEARRIYKVVAAKLKELRQQVEEKGIGDAKE